MSVERWYALDVKDEILEGLLRNAEEHPQDWFLYQVIADRLEELGEEKEAFAWRYAAFRQASPHNNHKHKRWLWVATRDITQPDLGISSSELTALPFVSLGEYKWTFRDAFQRLVVALETLGITNLS